MYFLVKGQVRVSHYMQNDEVTRDELRLVQADTSHDAEEKFRKFFEDMTDEYAVYYFVSNINVLETIT